MYSSFTICIIRRQLKNGVLTILLITKCDLEEYLNTKKKSIRRYLKYRLLFSRTYPLALHSRKFVSWRTDFRLQIVSFHFKRATVEKYVDITKNKG